MTECSPGGVACSWFPFIVDVMPFCTAAVLSVCVCVCVCASLGETECLDLHHVFGHTPDLSRDGLE